MVVVVVVVEVVESQKSDDGFGWFFQFTILHRVTVDGLSWNWRGVVGVSCIAHPAGLFHQFFFSSAQLTWLTASKTSIVRAGRGDSFRNAVTFLRIFTTTPIAFC
jgi:hypothetical protein